VLSGYIGIGINNLLIFITTKLPDFQLPLTFALKFVRHLVNNG